MAAHERIAPSADPGGINIRNRIPFSVHARSMTDGNGSCPSHDAICARFFSSGIGAKRSSQTSQPSVHNGHTGTSTPFKYCSFVRVSGYVLPQSKQVNSFSFPADSFLLPDKCSCSQLFPKIKPDGRNGHSHREKRATPT